MDKISAFDLGAFRLLIVPAGKVIYRDGDLLGQMCYVGDTLDELNRQIADGVYTCEPPRPEPEPTEDTEND